MDKSVDPTCICMRFFMPFLIIISIYQSEKEVLCVVLCFAKHQYTCKTMSSSSEYSCEKLKYGNHSVKMMKSDSRGIYFSWCKVINVQYTINMIIEVWKRKRKGKPGRTIQKRSTIECRSEV